jgi:hypothetical protein
VLLVARRFAREVVTTREHERTRRSPGVLEREVRGPTDRALRFCVDLLSEAQQRLLADLVGIVEVYERRPLGIEDA